MAWDHRVERARKLRTDQRDPLIDVSLDLLAALVALAELEARIFRKRLHPLANRSLRVSQRLQDRVHPPLQLRELLEAHLVDLVGRHGRGRRGLERPAVIFVAVRARPHAGDVGGLGTLQPELVDLALKRGNDRADRDLSSACIPVAGDALLLGPFHERFDNPAASLRVLQRNAELVEGLVDQEARRDEALGAGGADSAEFTIQLARIWGESM